LLQIPVSHVITPVNIHSSCQACATPSAAAAAADSCKPFDLSRYGHSTIDSFCAKLNSLSDAQLKELHAAAPLPSETGGFPIRGCTHRCIAGSSFAALVAKMPENNLGWGGKW
jgi:hypothetical protein